MSGKGSSHKSSSSSHRKSRWEGNKNQSSGSAPGSEGIDTKSKASSQKDDTQVAGSSTEHVLPQSGSVPLPLPPPGMIDPPPPPAYGFHMLERRTIVLADGSVRTYFALPPDYVDFPVSRQPLDPGFDRHFPPTSRMSPDGFRRDHDDPYVRGGTQDYWNSLGLDNRDRERGMGPPPDNSLKRKYREDDGRDVRDDFSRQRQQLLQYGNVNGGERRDFMVGTSSPVRRGISDIGRAGEDMRFPKNARVGKGEDVAANVDLKNVNPQALKKAFLKFAKAINENAADRRNYLDDGKNGSVQCLACDRGPKEFSNVHGLIIHAYNIQNAESRVEHLGFHKALCVLMGWNYTKVPDNSKAYQSFSSAEAEANRDDQIMWPPTVIIHNTNYGRKKDGRMEGMGNKDMDIKLKELGFSGGKSKSIYGKEGHMGITLVKFASDESGMKEAERLSEYFRSEGHGRKDWDRVQASKNDKDNENNPDLVRKEGKKGEKKRIFYGYLGTASDLDKVDFDTRKRSVIKSRREFDLD